MGLWHEIRGSTPMEGWSDIQSRTQHEVNGGYDIDLVATLYGTVIAID